MNCVWPWISSKHLCQWVTLSAYKGVPNHLAGFCSVPIQLKLLHFNLNEFIKFVSTLSNTSLGCFGWRGSSFWTFKWEGGVVLYTIIGIYVPILKTNIYKDNFHFNIIGGTIFLTLNLSTGWAGTFKICFLLLIHGIFKGWNFTSHNTKVSFLTKSRLGASFVGFQNFKLWKLQYLITQSSEIGKWVMLRIKSISQ